MMSDSDWWDDVPAPSEGSGGTAAGSGATAAQGARGPVPDMYQAMSDFGEVDAYGTQAPHASDNYFGDDYAIGSEDYTPTPPTPLTMLYLAVGAATAGLLIGLVVNYLIGGRATGGTVAVAAVGWLLAGIVAVVGVARYQAQELRQAATSTFYVPNPSASLLRLVPLIIGAAGVILTSYYIADWVARR